MHLRIHIKDKTERVAFAANIKSILRNAGASSTEYIPGIRLGVKADIGIKAEKISLNILAQIVSQIERRGYALESTKGPESLDLSFSMPIPH